MRTRTLRTRAGGGSQRERASQRRIDQSLGNREFMHLERATTRQYTRTTPARLCPDSNRQPPVTIPALMITRTIGPGKREVSPSASGRVTDTKSILPGHHPITEHELAPSRDHDADRDPEPARPLAPAVEVGHRGLAGLAVRRPGHAPVHAGRRPVRRGAARPSRTRGTRASAGTARWIQAAFLLGWALGGGFFGRIGDRLGRSRALSLTILTYALFTGLSAFAQTWWHLLIFRFLAALGHRRRVGGRRVAAVGDLAQALAALDRGGAADRGQHRRPAGRGHDLRARRPEPPPGLPGRRPARPARLLDPPRGPRARGVARRPRGGAGPRGPASLDLFRADVRRTHDPDDPRLLASP